ENERRHVELHKPLIPANVKGVPVRLERVIENLLDNAVSFSPPDGTIDVTITIDDDWVAVLVSDEGRGIAADAREKVFRRFHSDRPDAEDFGNHSGLGLAIARTIAEAHDGTLHARDRADARDGACLILRLPYIMPADQ
ncbi:MAG: ATP-binding protein, partial [Pontixanthobacter sp.]